MADIPDIPDRAAEAAAEVIGRALADGCWQYSDVARRALEAAAPHMPGEGGRAAVLGAVARDMLSRFVKTQDGYRARVGQVQIEKWAAQLGEVPGG